MTIHRLDLPPPPKPKAASQHVNDLAQWKGPRAVNLDALRYQVHLVHDGKTQHIEGILPDLEWTDAAISLSGSINLIRPTVSSEPLHATHGDLVRLFVRWAGGYLPLWDMRVWDPDDDIGSGSMTASLNDDLYPLTISRDNFKYRRNKKKSPQGFKCHEILIDIAKRYHIPLGHIAEGVTPIYNLDMTDVSPLDAIVKAYQEEKAATGLRFVIHWRGGKLNVVPLVRNEILYTLHQQLESVASAITAPDSYATALTGRWTQKDTSTKDSHGHTKVKHTKRSLTVYGDLDRGFIHQQVNLHGIDSDHEASVRLKHLLANRQRLKPVVTVTHGLIPFIRRGDTTQVYIPERGFVGDRSEMWVTQADYHLDGSNPTMDLQFSWDDPLKSVLAAQKKLDAAARAGKRVGAAA